MSFPHDVLTEVGSERTTLLSLPHDVLTEVGVDLPRGALGTTPLAPGRLAEVVRHLAGAAERWRPIARPVGRSPGEPARTRLLWAPAVEVWLVEWAPGQATPAHDHGGAATAFSVLHGALAEECLDVTIWTTCRRTTWRAPSTAAFGPGHVHLLGNAGSGPAASVHARSPASRAAGKPAQAQRSGRGQPLLCGTGTTSTGTEERWSSL